jgi:hypothetical protein
MFIAGSDAELSGSVVRDNLPNPIDLVGGAGISAQPMCLGTDCYLSARANASIVGSLIENNRSVGMLVAASDAVVANSVVRATQPSASDQRQGRGISVQLACTSVTDCNAGERSQATIAGSLIADNYDTGLWVSASDVIVEDTALLSTRARALDELYGDGIALFDSGVGVSASVTRVLIDDSARAGIASFGGFVSIGETAIRCAAFALDGESTADATFEFEDRGANACGCPTADGECKAVSSGLEVPEPLPPL